MLKRFFQNLLSPDDENRLVWAAHDGRIKDVKYYLGKGIHSPYALREAAAGGHDQIVALLLPYHEADEKAINESAFDSAEKNHISCLQILLPKCTSNIYRAAVMEECAKHGHTDIVLGLWDECSEGQREATLRSAVWAGQTRTAEALMARGMDPCAHNCSLVSIAAQSGNAETFHAVLREVFKKAANEPDMIRHALQSAFNEALLHDNKVIAYLAEEQIHMVTFYPQRLLDHR